MSEQEMVVSLDELNRLEVQCPDCKAGILLDTAEKPERKITTTKCPVCGLDHLSTEIVPAYQTFVNKVRENKATLRFHIKQS